MQRDNEVVVSADSPRSDATAAPTDATSAVLARLQELTGEKSSRARQTAVWISTQINIDAVERIAAEALRLGLSGDSAAQFVELQLAEFESDRRAVMRLDRCIAAELGNLAETSHELEPDVAPCTGGIGESVSPPEQALHTGCAKRASSVSAVRQSLHGPDAVLIEHRI
eukprot:4521951-Prymnesium_polylepis.1